MSTVPDLTDIPDPPPCEFCGRCVLAGGWCCNELREKYARKSFRKLIEQTYKSDRGLEEAGVEAMLAQDRQHRAQMAHKNHQLSRCAEVLGFYASAETYHAIAIIPDRPAGAFADDFSDDHGDEDYARAMPGKAARALLTRLDAEENGYRVELNDGRWGTVVEKGPANTLLIVVDGESMAGYLTKSELKNDGKV